MCSLFYLYSGVKKRQALISRFIWFNCLLRAPGDTNDNVKEGKKDKLHILINEICASGEDCHIFHGSQHKTNRGKKVGLRQYCFVFYEDITLFKLNHIHQIKPI